MQQALWMRQGLGAAVVAVAVSGCSKSAQNYLERGDAQLNKGNVEAAVLEYRNAVAKDPMFAPARLKLADAYLRQGNGAGALAESVRAADLLPNDVGRAAQGGVAAADGRPGRGREGARGQGARDRPQERRRARAARQCAGRPDGPRRRAQADAAGAAARPARELQTNLGRIQAARATSPRPRPRSGRPWPPTRSRWPPSSRWASSSGAPGSRPTPRRRSRPRSRSTRPTAPRIARSRRSTCGRTAPPRPSPTSRRSPRRRRPPTRRSRWPTTTWAMRRPADAMAVLEKLSADPRYWALARAQVADIQMAEGKSAEAFRTVDEVVAKQPAPCRRASSAAGCCSPTAGSTRR